jgi:hypothetical protein
MSKEEKILIGLYEIQEKLKIRENRTSITIQRMIKHLEECIKKEQIIPTY